MSGGNQFQKVQPGQRRVVPAAVWNAMLDAVEYVQAQRASGGALTGRSFGQRCVVPLHGGGVARERFEAVPIAGAAWGPTDSPDEFGNLAFLNYDTTTVPGWRRRFGVLLEPLEASGVARVCVAGACIATVNVADENHGYAHLSSQGGGPLESGQWGGAVILWKESGTGNGKLAVVQVGIREPAFCYGKVQTGHVNGSFTALLWNNAQTVSVKQCSETGYESGGAFDVKIPTPASVASLTPSLFAGDIIRIAFDDDGTPYCVSPYLDDCVGTVKIWWSQRDPPRGWALCDGQNGTQDWRDKFFKMISAAEIQGATGGYARHGATENGHPDHAEHYHEVIPQSTEVQAGAGATVVTNVAVWTAAGKDIMGNAINWAHKGPGFLDDTDNRPPFVAVKLIMRVE